MLKRKFGNQRKFGHPGKCGRPMEFADKEDMRKFTITLHREQYEKIKDKNKTAFIRKAIDMQLNIEAMKGVVK